jgi:hypothetical protein
LLPITPRACRTVAAPFRAALAVAARRRGAGAIDERISTLALALVNEGDQPSHLRARPHGACLRWTAIESLSLARRGEVSALDALLRRSPDVLASEPHAATLLQLAVLGGRKAVVELLLERGVDVDKPAAIRALIFLTPLGAARLRRRDDTEALLLARGAREDIFTHALLGDLPRLREDLARDPSTAQANDPAVDALEITPVHHAVGGEQVERCGSAGVRARGPNAGQCARAAAGGGARERDNRAADRRAWR